MTARNGSAEWFSNGTTGPSARIAFWRYTAALDAGEAATAVYASLVRRVGHPATSDGDRSGPVAA